MNDEFIETIPMSDRAHPRELAREAVADYYRRMQMPRECYLAASLHLPLRESSGPRYFPVGAVERWWRADVIKPESGEIEQELYGANRRFNG